MNDKHRCSRVLRWWGAVLLCLAALPPATASLLIERTAVEAWTELFEPVQLRSPRQHAVWQLGQPPGPMTAVAADRTATLAAAARQTPDGFFQSVVTHQRGWEDSSGLRLATAGTQFTVTVSTNEADTPLVLDFLFLGSQLQAGAHYGAGRLEASATLLISAAISTAPFPVVAPVWGFQDTLLLDTRDAFDPPRVVVHDTMGIGLPQVHASAGWTNFDSWAVHDRDPMIGTLDFGLLQPGQFFSMSYFSAVQIEAETTYLGHARAEVIDPFGLRDDPPLQLQLRGLALPAPVGVVPEPASAAQALAGGLLLVLLARRRQRQGGRRLLAAPLLLAMAVAAAPARADVLDYPIPFGNFYGDQPGVLDVHHRVTHLGANIDGLQWWAGGYDDLGGVAWSPNNSAGTLAHVDLRVLDGQPLRLDGFRLGSWAGAEGRLETVTVTGIGSSAPAWQFTGLIGVGNLANSFDVGLQSTTGFTITWTNPWWTAIDDIRFQTSAVPEPGAGWLLLAGLPLLGAMLRCRRD